MKFGSRSLLDRLVEDKDDFHACRWRCLRYPDRAVETLSPYAQLDVSVISGRRLHAWTPSHTFQPPGSPFVRAFVNDRKAFETSAVRSTTPRWAHDGQLGITAPRSMVRLEVLDHDSLTHTEEIGFVEFSVGDLPWDRQVEGWLELRISDMLERTSYDRYATHSSGRDDEVDERHEVRQRLLSSQPSCGLGACNRAPQTEFPLRNAGEVLVRLRLRRQGSWLDSAFALALDPPPPKFFTVKRRPTSTDALPMLDVQDLRDEITDIKVAVVDGALASAANFCSYILQWRSTVLSLVVAAALIGTWLLPALTWVVIPALLAGMLVLLSSKRVRSAMTLGGANAPLSQDGFERVARWRSKASMVRFLRRVVEQDLQGRVLEETSLAACAANVFSNGVPKIKYTELREGLRDAKWTSSTKDGLSPGSLVVVSSEEGHRRAKVQKVTNGGDVSVKYDDGPEHSVRGFQVTPRPLMPSVPAWIIPQDVSTQLRVLEAQLSDIRKRLLGPVTKISNVLTWRWPCAAFCLTLLLAAISASEALIVAGVWGDLPAAIGGRVLWVVGAAMDFVKATFRIAAFVVGVLFLTYRSPFLVEARSIAKILLRLLTMRRRAPQSWPFFRETNAMTSMP
mmetsp:Transcript_137691/g.427784  ORF Transcript_137691/g.427784 Transcript_137691/m.427784 type:complete len:623 (-) Transcript_137691:142-2010(-)